MTRVDLHSTSLIAATYKGQSAVLELQFRSGAIYQYLNVPAQTYQALLGAESKGRYFNQHIRNCFRYAKVDPAHSGATPYSALNTGTE